VGHVDQAWRAFAAADVAVLPSQHEGFPNSLIEAMAVGVPVIASNVGGIPDAVVDGKTGLLFPVNDEDALTAAMDRLAGDSAERESLSAAALSAMDAYRIETVIAKLERLYESLRRVRT
jgi:glycosyltransferase involved in cell wall biosynthesis